MNVDVVVFIVSEDLEENPLDLLEVEAESEASKPRILNFNTKKGGRKRRKERSTRS